MKINRKNLEKIWVIEKHKNVMDIMDFWHSINFFIYEWTQRIQNYSCWFSFDELKEKFQEYKINLKKFTLDLDKYKTVKLWEYDYRKILNKCTCYVRIYNPNKEIISKYRVKRIDWFPKIRINYKWIKIWDKI